MHRIDDDERRARLALRHHLAVPAGRVEDVAQSLVGLHSSDPISVYLSARARVARFEVAALERALYDDRSLVRMLGMRRTMFVVPRSLAAAIDVGCTQAYAAGERRRLAQMLEQQGIASDGARWLTRVARRTVAALEARGEATAVELTAEVPELGAKLSFGEGKTWGGQVGVSTRLLFVLAAEGRIVRARPLGSWVSSQYRWAPWTTWLDEPLPRLEPGAARAEVLGRWLRAFGPATEQDVRWWTGWTARAARDALDALGAVEVALDHGTGFVLPDDLAPPAGAGRWVALLPGLDPTVMGWKERDWYLGPHVGSLFDRNGNAGPTVWSDGRIVGGWSQAGDGGLAVHLLEPVDARARRAIDAEAQRLERWLGATRITPRFRTPLEKQLAGSREPAPDRDRATVARARRGRES